MNQYKSIYNWLGLGLLVFVALGLCYFSMSGQPGAESDESPAASAHPTQSLALASSPLEPSSQVASPLSADLASPLPAQEPATAETILPFELTVLHTNDTWGYLLPCG